MNKTSIPWCDLTWNPITGCTRGCPYCYAARIADRFCTGAVAKKSDLTAELLGGAEYVTAPEPHPVEDRPGVIPIIGNGAFPVGFYPTVYPHRLDEPLRRKKPSVIFLGSMGDLFDPAFPDDFRDRIMGTIIECSGQSPFSDTPRHTFMLLTKQPENMRRYFAALTESRLHPGELIPNLWLGVTVTNQADADERIPLLLDTPAAHRFVSVEPMLGPMDLGRRLAPQGFFDALGDVCGHIIGEVVPQVQAPGINLVIIGAKTPGKPLHDSYDCDSRDASCDDDYCSDNMPNTCPASWLRSLRDQCLTAGVPLHYKHGGTNPALDGIVYDWKPGAS